MSEQLRREGDNLQRLLEDIQQEFGPTVQIVSANKRRVGGVLGFFAKQQYVVLAQVSQPTTPTRPTRETSPSAAAVGPLRAAKVWGDAAAKTVAVTPNLEPEPGGHQRHAADVLALVAGLGAPEQPTPAPSSSLIPTFSAAPAPAPAPAPAASAPAPGE